MSEMNLSRSEGSLHSSEGPSMDLRGPSLGLVGPSIESERTLPRSYRPVLDLIGPF